MPTASRASGFSSARIWRAPTGNWFDGFGTGCTVRVSCTTPSPDTPAFSGVTEKPEMSMRPQALPVVSHRLSCTAPPPTMANSWSQAASSSGW